MKNTKRDLLMETNRRLQETTQELFMAKEELEKKNKELEEARRRENIQKEKLEQLERASMERLARLPDGQASPITKVKAEPRQEKKITAKIAEDLSLKYITLLESYVKTKDLDKDESLVEEFCQNLIGYGVTPKGIVSMHLKAVPQVKTIGDLETRRITFESRMVLLNVMTHYASLLLKNKDLS